MKQISMNIILLLASVFCFGQNNREFVDSIKMLIIQEKIPIYDSTYNKLKNDEILNQFVWLDTMFREVLKRPKFIDNIYIEPFDEMVVKSPIALDTISDKTDVNYLSFFKKEYDDIGNYLGNRILFKIDKRIDNSSVTSRKAKRKQKRILKKWVPYEIIRLGKRIELDSCHKRCRLEFESKNYKQYYEPSNDECFTEEMKNSLKVGLDGNSENLDSYYNKVEGHFIENRTGKWFAYKDKLILQPENGSPMITFVIEKLNHKKLIIKNEELSYKIYLKDASR